MKLQKLLHSLQQFTHSTIDKSHEKKRIASLRNALLAKIKLQGSISFHDFMESALYDPTVGFYMKRIIFGEDKDIVGDFVTNPKKFSPYYGQGIASLISQLDESNQAKGGIQRIVSIAGGDGTLDRDLLDWMKKHNPELYQRVRYESVEISQRQIDSQQKMLGSHIKKVTFIKESGIEYLKNHKQKLQQTFIFSNEWLDTLPVHIIVKKRGEWKEVRIKKNWKRSFHKTIGTIQETATVEKFLQYAQSAGRGYKTSKYENYHINVPSKMIETAEALSQALVSGFSLMIDYGLVGGEPTQSILAFTRNKKLKNILAYPGSIDITTYIDWDIWTQASAGLMLQTVICDLILITHLTGLTTESIEDELRRQIKNPAILQSTGGYTLSKKLRENLRHAEEESSKWFHEGVYGAWMHTPHPANSIQTILWYFKKKVLAGERLP